MNCCQKTQFSGFVRITFLIFLLILVIVTTAIVYFKLKTPKSISTYVTDLGSLIRNSPSSTKHQSDNTASGQEEVKPTNIIPTEDLTFHSPVQIGKFMKNIDEDNNLYTLGCCEYELEFYKVGKVTKGKYKDFEIIRGDFRFYAVPGKGPKKHEPFYFRFLKKDNNLILLSSISSYDFINSDTYNKPSEVIPWNITVDTTTTLEPFERHSGFQITGGSIGYIDEELGNPNEILYKLFSNPVLGEVYTTKVKYSPQEPFYGGEDDDYPYKTSGGFGYGKNSCVNTECYYTNALFIFNPDGTFRIYEYRPNDLYETVNINNQNILISPGSYYSTEDDFQTYITITKTGCSDNNADYISIMDPADVSIDDLKTISESGRKYYFFKNNDHPYLKHYYEKYLLYFPDMISFRFQIDKNTKPLSYYSFIEALPVIFTEDEFGRLIRITNYTFIPPFACEPIIYLYPEKETQVEVSLDTNKVNIITSDPDYEKSWIVNAKPSGEVSNTEGKYPYLFWEGVLKRLPKRQDGFVVERDNVTKFFKTELPKLGLSPQETRDFIEAWADKLSYAPYYFITFHSKEVIDEWAPLKINPKPDTVIRVLMEYKPLVNRKTVLEFNYPDTPQRNGFTTVEWGGIEY